MASKQSLTRRKKPTNDLPPPPPPENSPILSPSSILRKAVVPVEKIERVLTSLSFHRRFWFIFGIVIGIALPSMLLAPSVLHKTGITDKDHLDEFITKQLVPFINQQLPTIDPESRPGRVLRRRGASAKHPVFLVPGFVTTGLELWEGQACSSGLFRQRMWGSTSMIKTLLTDVECWTTHLTLDPVTGLDPPGIRLRSAQGFEAADYVVGNYWVWARLIENLADIGYSGSNMHMAAYDWRLSPKQLETRDSYFSMLKASIEVSTRAKKEKAVIVSHSMGSSHVFYFLQWVEKDGGGGKGWVDKHIASTVNIAGAFLGSPNAMTSVISGETRDTAEMSTFEPLIEKIFGRSKRQQMFATWGSVWTLFAKGGEAVWPGNFITFFGDGTSATSTTAASDFTRTSSSAPGHTKSDLNSMILEFGLKNRTTSETLRMISTWGSGHGKALVDAIGVEVDESVCDGGHNTKCFGNPLVSPLWKGTNFTTYCLYGVGLPTEVSYYYKRNPAKDDGVPWILDTTFNAPEEGVRVGVKFADGDATVPLASLGYMCRRGWVNGPNAAKLNPSKLRTVTREYPFVSERSYTDLGRGGPRAADHVDIMGNTQVSRQREREEGERLLVIGYSENHARSELVLRA